MADINKTIEIQFKVNNTPLQTVSGSVEDVTKKVEELEKAAEVSNGKLTLMFKGAEISAKDLNEQLKVTGDNTGGTNENIGKLDKGLGSLKKQFADARNAAADAKTKFGENSVEFKNAASKAGALKEEIESLNRTLSAQKSGVDAAIGALKGAAGAFGVLESSVALFGVQNDEVQKSLLKVQAALTLVSSIDAVGDSIESFSVLKTKIMESTVVTKANELATKATAATMKVLSPALKAVGIATEETSVAFKGLKGALVATGIGALVLILGELYANWDKIKEALTGVTEKERTYNDIIKETNKESAGQVATLDSLYRKTVDIKNSTEQRTEAAKKLQETYPQTFANFTAEEIMLGKAKVGYDELRDSIVQTALAKAKQSKVDELAVKYAEEDLKNQKDILEKRKQLEEIKKKGGVSVTYVSGGGGMYGSPGGTEIRFTTEDAQKQLDAALDKQKQSLAKFNKEVDEILGVSIEKSKKNNDKLIISDRDTLRLKISNLEKAGKDTNQLKLQLANLELSQLEVNSKAYIDKQIEINGIEKAIKDAHLKVLADKNKKQMDLIKNETDQIKSKLETDLQNAEKQKLIDLDAAKSVDEKIEVEKKYNAKIKQLKDDAATAINNSYKKNIKDKTILAQAEADMNAAMAKNDTDYVKANQEAQQKLDDITKARIDATEEGAKKIAEINQQYTDYTINKTIENNQKERDKLTNLNEWKIGEQIKALKKLKDLDKKDATDNLEKAKNDAEKEATQKLDELQKAKDKELELYKGNADKEKEINDKYTAAEIVVNNEKNDKINAANEKHAQDLAKIDKENYERVKKVAQNISKIAARAAQDIAAIGNAFNDLFQAQIDRIEKTTQKQLDALNKEKEAKLKNQEITDAQRIELERMYAEKATKIEEEKQAKIKEIQKKQAAIQLTITIAQTIANTASAIAAALDLPPPFNIIEAAVVAAAGAIQIAAATEQYNTVQALAKGGMVYGPGTENSDSIPAMLSNGEAVINAKAVKKFAPILSAINQSTGGAAIKPHFAAGGVVTANPGEVAITNIQDIANIAGQSAVRAYILQSDVTSSSVKNQRILRNSRFK